MSFKLFFNVILFYCKSFFTVLDCFNSCVSDCSTKITNNFKKTTFVFKRRFREKIVFKSQNKRKKTILNQNVDELQNKSKSTRKQIIFTIKNIDSRIEEVVREISLLLNIIKQSLHKNTSLNNNIIDYATKRRKKKLFNNQLKKNEISKSL